jgi:flagellar hook-basal body complex protein FliE
MVAPIGSVPAAPVAPLPPIGGGMTAGMLQVAQGAQLAAGAAQAGPLASFQEFFADAVKRTNDLDVQSREKQRQLLVGETDNIHEVMIAMEKAGLSFQLTLAVRNKVIEAYQEVMRMQI